MFNSGLINLNVVKRATEVGVKKLFFSSSACIYPHENRPDPHGPHDPNYREESAYPAMPANEYGWEKLFSERLYLAHARNKDLNVHIARFHTTYGPEGTWRGGREKFPAALCRKIAEAPDSGAIEIWGDGEQTRSFTYVDDCIEGIQRLVGSDFVGPVNVGSDEMTTINDMARMVIEISGKQLTLQHVPGPQGPRGRNSHNDLIKERLDWAPSISLREGMAAMYDWVRGEVEKARA
jgi:nucleoside-diphosphate-sugar epimerase